MEFKKAMRTVKRICEAVGSCNKCELLGNCPFVTVPSNIDLNKIEAILTKWTEEHPERTIMDDFLEKHPKAPKDEDGIPFACAQRCGYTEGCIGNTSRKYCAQCWRRPLEEV